MTSVLGEAFPLVGQQTAQKPPTPVQSQISGPISEQDQATQAGQQASEQFNVNAAQAPSTAQTGIAANGVNSALASQIAKAISLGLAPPPTTMAGWAKLVDFYSTTAGENELNAANLASGGIATGISPTGASQPGAGTNALGTNAFLAAIRQHESGGNYTAYNAAGGASGAYQFIQSTWANAAKEAGYGQYAGGPASSAPPSVQDAVAAHMANAYFSKYGSWQDAAEAWYDPALVGQNVVPSPGAGNKETVAAYGAQIVSMMGQQPQLDAAHPAAGSTSNVVKIAQGQLGIPYQWGGENPGHSFDCSGLVQWSYAQTGVKLPRTAQAQYSATAKIAKGAPLQPGDLLFFGSGPNGVEHVGIYIGNNQMIDAPHTGADVRVDNNPTSWGNFVGATRPGDGSGASTAGTPSPSDGNFGSILQTVTQQLAALHQAYPGAGEHNVRPKVTI